MFLNNILIICIICLSFNFARSDDPTACTSDDKCADVGGKGSPKHICIDNFCQPIAKHEEKCTWNRQCQEFDADSLCLEDPKKEKFCACKPTMRLSKQYSRCLIKSYCEADGECPSGFKCKANVCQESITAGWVYILSTLSIVVLVVVVGIGLVYRRGRHS